MKCSVLPTILGFLIAFGQVNPLAAEYIIAACRQDRTGKSRSSCL